MDDSETAIEANESAKNISTSSKESEPENVDAIKKFIEDQEKEIQDQKCDDDMNEKRNDECVVDANTIKVEEPLAVAASVMDLILSETETRMLTKKEEKSLEKQCFSPNEKSMLYYLNWCITFSVFTLHIINLI